MFQTNSLTLFPYIFWFSGKTFSQFKQKMKILAYTYLKFHFCPQIYNRFYQITDIEIKKTSEQNRILTYCKKQCFKFIELFTDNQTWFFDPDSP